MQTEDVTIINRLGLHARAASVFVKKSAQFASTVTVIKGDRKANGKSIMSMLMLEAAKGTTIQLATAGDDEVQALEALVALVRDRFGEDE
ncbi:MAG: HPr family phosphocarrier protein [Proteobacteria bacterium]|jgi:phosphocarrier protein HPr|nr:HPr family phosphocarrier protein [Pseudomonadota bacterium]